MVSVLLNLFGIAGDAKGPVAGTRGLATGTSGLSSSLATIGEDKTTLGDNAKNQTQAAMQPIMVNGSMVAALKNTMSTPDGHPTSSSASNLVKPEVEETRGVPS